MLASGKGSFSGARDWGNNGRLLIILADNYNHTTNDPTTEAQSARRTHRDFSREIRCSLQLGDPCELSAAAPGSPSTVCGAAALVAARGLELPGLLRCRSAGLPGKRSCSRSRAEAVMGLVSGWLAFVWAALVITLFFNALQ